MAKLEKLPSELLIQIFQYLRDGGSKGDVLSWSLSSQHFRDIGTLVLYKYISLDIFRIGSFVAAITALEAGQRKARLRNMQSLTLWIPRLESGNLLSQTYDCTEPFRLLAKMVRKMENLKTFSFISKTFFAAHDKHPPLKLSDTSLLDVLSALPESVVNLELDTAGLDPPRLQEYQPEPCELCGVIKRILPKLQHLRLRLRSLCPAILHPQELHDSKQVRPGAVLGFPLRTMAIWLSPGEYQSDLRLCSGKTPHGLRSRSVFRGLRNTLVKSAQNLVYAGHLPKIQCLIFLERARFSDKQAWITRNVLTGETSAVPIQMFEGQCYQTPVIPYLDRQHTLRLPNELANGEDEEPWKEYVGTYEDLKCLVEGEGAWIQSVTGSRFPTVSHCHKAMIEIAKEPFQDAATFRATSSMICYIWARGTSWNARPGKGSHILGNVELVELPGRRGRRWGYVVKPH